MKQTTNFNISVPELGDRPDITQVSNAIQDLENALAGTVEVLNATIEGTKVTLVSGSRTTSRIRYYEGMAVRFVTPVAIQPNELKTVSIDGMRDQALLIPYLVVAGDLVDIVFSGDKFTGVLVGVPKSNEINSNATDKVATPKAINTLRAKVLDDSNSIWGGEYGGYIQDETITKEVGKRYIDEFNKKAYICKKPSNVNTEDAYAECNVVNNLYKLQNLTNFKDMTLLVMSKTKPALGSTLQYSETINNFSLICIRAGANPSNVDLETGKDCCDYLLPIKRTGFTYIVNTTGKGAIKLESNSCTFSPSDADTEGFKYGVAIFGIGRVG